MVCKFKKKATEEDAVSTGVKFILERKQCGSRANLLRDGHHTSIYFKYPFKPLSRTAVSILGIFCSCPGVYLSALVCCRATRRLLGDSSGGHSEGGGSHRVRLGRAVPGTAGAPSAVKTDHWRFCTAQDAGEGQFWQGKHWDWDTTVCICTSLCVAINNICFEGTLRKKHGII